MPEIKLPFQLYLVPLKMEIPLVGGLKVSQRVLMQQQKITQLILLASIIRMNILHRNIMVKSWLLRLRE